MRGVIILCILAMGCTTVETLATYDPVLDDNGNAIPIIDPATGAIIGVAAAKSIHQNATVTMGGKLKEGMFDFNAEAVGGDGSYWTVHSGQKASGATSPNIVKDVGDIALKGVGLGLQAQAQRYEFEASQPLQPQTPSIEERLLDEAIRRGQ